MSAESIKKGADGNPFSYTHHVLHLLLASMQRHCALTRPIPRTHQMFIIRCHGAFATLLMAAYIGRRMRRGRLEGGRARAILRPVLSSRRLSGDEGGGRGRRGPMHLKHHPICPARTWPTHSLSPLPFFPPYGAKERPQMRGKGGREKRGADVGGRQEARIVLPPPS